MLFWIVIAFLTFVVTASFLMPFLRGGRRAEVQTRDGAMAVYRDQLQELERDKAGALISSEEADYARAEIARRLLAAESGAAVAIRQPSRHILAQAFVVLLVPAIGLGLYLTLGSPDLPSQPLAERLAAPGNDINLLIAKAERHLMEKPDDGAGWDVLAPIYMRQNRIGDAQLAYQNAIRLNGASVDRLNGLGEAIIAQNDGIVTDDARDLFRRSATMSDDNPRADYYLALALEQAGKKPEALAAFKAIAAKSPPNAPWQPLVARHIAQNGGAGATPAPLGNPDAAAVAAAQSMSDEDRQKMVAGMVASLDAKLKADPKNFEGWMRLVRSYVMLKEPAKALDALKTALKSYPANGDEGKQLIAAAKALGLSVEEALQ
ncbi:c-type cytochrome biogenesis protein CcmI [Rhizobium sp.]|jgi:cytochrome c-type biogenesis protein CcmH|uniref:c-type cytochrome biogenesis protein CcmI n=1 Tax=Rhizobium sp. TaxID=391 RepID=UPI000E8C1236|nr:c-type cytochrome biogenesis protein CcmI [Rhizobium sp.]